MEGGRGREASLDCRAEVGPEGLEAEKQWSWHLTGTCSKYRQERQGGDEAGAGRTEGPGRGPRRTNASGQVHAPPPAPQFQLHGLRSLLFKYVIL